MGQFIEIETEIDCPECGEPGPCIFDALLGSGQFRYSQQECLSCGHRFQICGSLDYDIRAP